MESRSRREFFKNILTVSAAMPVVAISAHLIAGSDVQADEPKPLDPKDPVATALGYHEEAAKVDPAKWTKKAADTANAQKCSSCMLFLGGDVKVPGSDKVWGRCQIFPGKLVRADGWCNSWVAKPA